MPQRCGLSCELDPALLPQPAGRTAWASTSRPTPTTTRTRPATTGSTWQWPSAPCSSQGPLRPGPVGQAEL